MSLIPQKNERLELYKGSTFDETWEIRDDDGALVDLTGWGAELKVRQDYDSAVLLTVASGVLVVGPTASAIVVGDAAGTLRIYIGSTVMAAITAASFKATVDEDGTTYSGVWDLETIKPGTLERFREVMGPVLFSPEVTYVG